MWIRVKMSFCSRTRGEYWFLIEQRIINQTLELQLLMIWQQILIFSKKKYSCGEVWSSAANEASVCSLFLFPFTSCFCYLVWLLIFSSSFILALLENLGFRWCIDPSGTRSFSVSYIHNHINSRHYVLFQRLRRKNKPKEHGATNKKERDSLKVTEIYCQKTRYRHVKRVSRQIASTHNLSSQSLNRILKQT